MGYMTDITEKIMESKNKEEIFDLLCDVYFSTQYDSTIREEFEKWAENSELSIAIINNH